MRQYCVLLTILMFFPVGIPKLFPQYIPGYNAPAVFAQLQESANYTGIRDFFYPETTEHYLNKTTLDSRYPALLAKAIVYSQSLAQLSRDFVYGLEERTRMVDGQWLADSVMPVVDMGDVVAMIECRLDPFNVTILGRDRYEAKDILNVMDELIERGVERVLVMRVKENEVVDVCGVVANTFGLMRDRLVRKFNEFS